MRLSLIAVVGIFLIVKYFVTRPVFEMAFDWGHSIVKGFDWGHRIVKWDYLYIHKIVICKTSKNKFSIG